MSPSNSNGFAFAFKAIKTAGIFAGALLASVLVVGEIEGCIQDAPYPLYSARIVDLSSIDSSQYAGAGFDTKMEWLTEPRAGVAMWDSRNQEFLVVPLARGQSDDLVAFGFPRDKILKPARALTFTFRPGSHFHCHPSEVSSLDIELSSHTPLVGRIQFSYTGQGDAIHYSGGDQYLF